MVKYIAIFIIFFSCYQQKRDKDERYIYVYSYKNSESDTTIVEMQGGIEKSYKCSSGKITFNYSIVNTNSLKLFNCLVNDEHGVLVERDSMRFDLNKISIKKYFFEKKVLNKIIESEIYLSNPNLTSWFDSNKHLLSYNSFSTFLSLLDYSETKEQYCTPFWNLDLLHLNSYLVLGLNKKTEINNVWEIDTDKNRFLSIHQNHFFKTDAKEQMTEHIIIGNSKKNFSLSDTVYINRLAGQDSLYKRYLCSDYIEGTTKEIFKSNTYTIKDSLRIINLNPTDTTVITIERQKGDKFYKEMYSNGINILRLSN
jgi:hypothetical protein